ncbi:MAG TPA: gamma-glutamylcyclotransferase family protein, partial [Oxalicibacterium sp.]|nr:gamma-glutamylcyclotransferase family protein [Oxalicibacterium sp.]
MHVFTYGSLMFPAVWRRVVRGSHRSLPAVLDGYARHAVRGELYPGIVHRPGASVEGVLYLDVNEAELAVLDGFEGSEYRRESVTVRTAADMQMVAADAYLFLAGHRLSGEAWEP